MRRNEKSIGVVRTFSIPEIEWEWAKELAQKECRSISNLIRKLLKDEYQKVNKEDLYEA